MDPTSPAVVVMMEEDNDRQASVQTPEDVSLFVQDLLQQMQTRFGEISQTIGIRMEEMSHRMDDLEQSVGELMQQAGLDAHQQARVRQHTAAALPPQTSPGSHVDRTRMSPAATNNNVSHSSSTSNLVDAETLAEI